MEWMIRAGIMAIGLVLLSAGIIEGLAQQKSANPQVVIQTSLGDITAELFVKEAPKSVDNFLTYTKAGFFTGTIFHRVIPGFMIQGGGMTADLKRKSTNPPIQNEAANGLKNLRGTLAMARTTDLHSATSQFFINTVDNAGLDHRGNDAQTFGYAVFGKVIDGMEVVDKIEKTPTGSKGSFQNVPTTPVVIKAVRVK